MPTETYIKKQVMQFLAKAYPAAVVRKRHGTAFATAGDPDLLILLNGVHIECELKQPGENPTPIQVSRLRKWQAAGARVAVIHSVEEMRQQMIAWGFEPIAARPAPRNVPIYPPLNLRAPA